MFCSQSHYDQLLNPWLISSRRCGLPMAILL
ncbi:unnamed protein product [Spirodela intermedia]|uniref:Uncharacterized protein n=1 Tax=Spirodela intermedia TaxID=51605 RepID=A0A7I8K140_SPIIN|nr:unnamed protein product [Spirodela intermedia]